MTPYHYSSFLSIQYELLLSLNPHFLTNSSHLPVSLLDILYCGLMRIDGPFYFFLPQNLSINISSGRNLFFLSFLTDASFLELQFRKYQ